MGTSMINLFKDAYEFPTGSSRPYFIGAFVRKIVRSARQVQHKGTKKIKKKSHQLEIPVMFKIAYNLKPEKAQRDRLSGPTAWCLMETSIINVLKMHRDFQQEVLGLI